MAGSAAHSTVGRHAATRRQRDQATLEQRIVYAQTELCRTHVLLEALGKTVAWSRCNSCHSCHALSI